MATKFLIDREKVKFKKTIAEILDITKIKAAPTVETEILANFVNALYAVSAGIKKAPKKQTLSGVVKEEGIEMPIRKLPAAPKPHQKEMVQKEPERKEYVVMLYNTPIGVVIDKNQEGSWQYSIIEPQVNPELIKWVKDEIEKDFKKNNALLDNIPEMTKIIQKGAKKKDVQYNEELYKKVLYHLKRDLLGFRRAEVLVHDPKVKGIYIDGVNKAVRIDVLNFPSRIETNIIFDDSVDLTVLINKIAASTGKVLNKDNPILNTAYEGFQIQATLGVGGVSSKLTMKKANSVEQLEEMKEVNEHEQGDDVAVRDYVRYTKHFGFKDQEIKKELEKAGWNEQQIHEAFAEFTKPELKLEASPDELGLPPVPSPN